MIDDTVLDAALNKAMDDVEKAHKEGRYSDPDYLCVMHGMKKMYEVFVKVRHGGAP